LENLKERPRHTWENIEMGIKTVRFEGVDWIHVAQDRV
jgi:hypothetical protein